MEYRNKLKMICGDKDEPGEGAIHAASDGSSRTRFGVAGWAYTIQKDDVFLHQSEVCQGYHDSEWAELRGLKDLTSFILERYEKLFKDRDIVIYVDSLPVYYGVTQNMKEWEEADFQFCRYSNPKKFRKIWKSIFLALLRLRLRGASIFIDHVPGHIYLRIHNLAHKFCTMATKKAGLKKTRRTRKQNTFSIVSQE